MGDAGAFVNEKLNTNVPWSDLVASGNLQKVLHAIVQRLDRQDAAIAGKAAGEGAGEGMTVIATKDLSDLRSRLGVLENHTLQGRIASLSPLEKAAAKAQEGLDLGKHVIPLTQMKSRIEAAEIGIQANAEAVERTNKAVAETAQALHKELQEALDKMATKEELRELERKHLALEAAMAKKFQETNEKIAKVEAGLQRQIDALAPRIATVEQRVETLVDSMRQLRNEMNAIESRTKQLEDEMPTKADKEEVERALKEIRDELAKINVEEIMDMVNKANQRIDAMDERCDHMEDEHRSLKESVVRWQKEMEDLQLEKQIEILRRELEEAKTGVFLKATSRMDAMQKDTDELKESLASTAGQVQINRENIEELEDLVRQHDPNASKSNGTKQIVSELQQAVRSLEERYAEAISRSSSERGKMEQTEAILVSLGSKLDEMAHAKADRNAVELALQVKADKDAVARDTQRNLQAVDEALSVMNAGTQGVQQLLEKQEGMVTLLSHQIQTKPDRDEFLNLQEQMGSTQNQPDLCDSEHTEAMYAKVCAPPINRVASGRGNPLF